MPEPELLVPLVEPRHPRRAEHPQNWRPRPEDGRLAPRLFCRRGGVKAGDGDITLHKHEFGALPGYAAGRRGACQAIFEGSGQAPEDDQGSTPYWRHLQEAVDNPIQPRRRLGGVSLEASKPPQSILRLS